MKLKKKNYNNLYLNLFFRKSYKKILSESHFQILKFKNFEIQFKKLLRLSFETFIKNKKLINCLFFNLVALSEVKLYEVKKKLFNLNFLQFCFKKKVINKQVLSSIFKVNFLKFNCLISTTFMKKFNNKLKKVLVDLTNIIRVTRDFNFLKKKNFFFTYNYLLFGNFFDLSFFFFFKV